MAEKENPDISRMSFDQALGELEELVKKLERGDAKLEEAILLYERGTALKAHCEAKLHDAQMKVEKITVQAGLPKTEPASFD
ncbi:MAG TPA: exodeoxyribonuclease VII small subunit [Dongiaceae bacterium]|nr:exodeoxyribonuclease VII small subunit [Dongiaceae bacterium]